MLVKIQLEQLKAQLEQARIFNETSSFKNFWNTKVEHITNKVKKLIGNKNIITNIYRIQACNSIICGYFCNGFIDFMLKNKILKKYTNLFSPNGYD